MNKPETSHNWIDISTEQYRTYIFLMPHASYIEVNEDDRGVEKSYEVKINKPQWLAVSENGHRIVDGGGISHYVPVGWVHLFWKPKEGASAFVA